MTPRRAAARTPLTLLILAFGHLPTYLPLEAGGLIAVLLAAVVLAPDPRSVPQRVLLLLCLLLRTHPGLWLDPQGSRCIPDAGCRRNRPPDS